MLNLQVEKIVRGSFSLFQSMYKPLVYEYAAQGLLKIPSGSRYDKFEQVSLLLEILVHYHHSYFSNYCSSYNFLATVEVVSELKTKIFPAKCLIKKKNHRNILIQ